MALKSREKMLLGGLALVGGALALYILVHEPLTTRRAEARDHLNQVEGQLDQEQRKLSREGDLDERKSRVAAREHTIDSWVPGKNSAALLIWHLSQAEQLSGVQIRSIEAGEKELVTVSPDDKKGKAAEGKATDAKDEKAAKAKDANAAKETAVTSLVVVPLEMKLDGKFAEHLIFNQYLEDTPLFLNTHGIELVRQGDLPIDKASRLVQGGNPWLAGEVLSQSPPVDGVYRVNLYFKADKPGQSTDEMHFDSESGRIDPFVMDAVDEFIRFLQAYFAGQPGDGTGPSDPSSPPQLG
ncbi:MAG: hypothetical protein ACOY94_13795 [Bacillota bacterium]